MFMSNSQQDENIANVYFLTFFLDLRYISIVISTSLELILLKSFVFLTEAPDNF